VKLDSEPCWLSAPRVELLVGTGTWWDASYPGLRRALTDHQSHGQYAAAVQVSAFGYYHAARCSACGYEIWNVLFREPALVDRDGSRWVRSDPSSSGLVGWYRGGVGVAKPWSVVQRCAPLTAEPAGGRTLGP
jgi:hypothetical protein